MYDKGVYRAKVKSQAIGESKNGTPQWILKFDILGKVHNGHLVECDNYERTIYCSLTEKGIPYILEDVKKLCEVGGVTFTLPKFECLDENTPGFLDLRGVEFDAYCKHEEYQGKTRERWSVAKFDSKPSSTPAKHPALASLNKQFASLLTPQDRKYPGVPVEFEKDIESGEDVPF